MNSVLIIGFTAEATDLTGLDISVESLRERIAAGDAEVVAAGYEVARGWVGTDHATGVAEVRELLTAHTFDVVLIGNGVRGFPRFTELFEQLVNAVHELAPRARFALNVDPPNTLEALQRNS